VPRAWSEEVLCAAVTRRSGPVCSLSLLPPADPGTRTVLVQLPSLAARDAALARFRARSAGVGDASLAASVPALSISLADLHAADAAMATTDAATALTDAAMATTDAAIVTAEGVGTAIAGSSVSGTAGGSGGVFHYSVAQHSAFVGCTLLVSGLPVAPTSLKALHALLSGGSGGSGNGDASAAGSGHVDTPARIVTLLQPVTMPEGARRVPSPSHAHAHMLSSRASVSVSPLAAPAHFGAAGVPASGSEAAAGTLPASATVPASSTPSVALTAGMPLPVSLRGLQRPILVSYDSPEQAQAAARRLHGLALSTESAGIAAGRNPGHGAPAGPTIGAAGVTTLHAQLLTPELHAQLLTPELHAQLLTPELHAQLLGQGQGAAVGTPSPSIPMLPRASDAGDAASVERAAGCAGVIGIADGAAAVKIVDGVPVAGAASTPSRALPPEACRFLPDPAQLRRCVMLEGVPYSQGLKAVLGHALSALGCPPSGSVFSPRSWLAVDTGGVAAAQSPLPLPTGVSAVPSLSQPSQLPQGVRLKRVLVQFASEAQALQAAERLQGLPVDRLLRAAEAARAARSAGKEAAAAEAPAAPSSAPEAGADSSLPTASHPEQASAAPGMGLTLRAWPCLRVVPPPPSAAAATAAEAGTVPRADTAVDDAVPSSSIGSVPMVARAPPRVSTAPALKPAAHAAAASLVAPAEAATPARSDSVRASTLAAADQAAGRDTARSAAASPPLAASPHSHPPPPQLPQLALSELPERTLPPGAGSLLRSASQLARCVAIDNWPRQRPAPTRDAAVAAALAPFGVPEVRRAWSQRGWAWLQRIDRGAGVGSTGVSMSDRAGSAAAGGSSSRSRGGGPVTGLFGQRAPRPVVVEAQRLLLLFSSPDAARAAAAALSTVPLPLLLPKPFGGRHGATAAQGSSGWAAAKEAAASPSSPGARTADTAGSASGSASGSGAVDAAAPTLRAWLCADAANPPSRQEAFTSRPRPRFFTGAGSAAAAASGAGAAVAASTGSGRGGAAVSTSGTSSSAAAATGAAAAAAKGALLTAGRQTPPRPLR
jgi:hypothetical protein